jgi:hypothetical protein
MSGHIIKKYQVEGEYVEEGARLFDVVDLSTVWIEAQVYEDELAFLHEGLEVTATAKAYPTKTFHGKIAFVHPHLDAATRTLRVRFDMANPNHELRPGMYTNVRLDIPAAQLDVFASELKQRWREGVAVESALMGGAASAGIGSLVQAGIDLAASRSGLVLAVPETAVIDTGSRKFVYREAEPGVYEGLLVELGPRSGAFYPVVRGIEPGDKVATAGAFLIDAETRLTGGLGSTYFGASGGPQGDKHGGSTVRASAGTDEDAKIRAALAKLGPEDQKLAEAQKLCPVLKGRLGGMGKPVKLMLQGQPVFLCCKGCEKEAKEHPEQMLRTIQEMKAGNGAPAPKTPPSAADPEEAEIVANLLKLSPADRELAQRQRFCATAPTSRLGSMGPPAKIMIGGQPVFLCCKGCEDEAKENVAATLATVEKLKRQTGR